MSNGAPNGMSDGLRTDGSVDGEDAQEHKGGLSRTREGAKGKTAAWKSVEMDKKKSKREDLDHVPHGDGVGDANNVAAHQRDKDNGDIVAGVIPQSANRGRVAGAPRVNAIKSVESLVGKNEKRGRSGDETRMRAHVRETQIKGLDGAQEPSQRDDVGSDRRGDKQSETLPKRSARALASD